jgi:gluconokinase
MSKTPTIIPGLRSPYETVGGLYHFGRMLDKIRLHAKGQLPPDWVSAMGAPKGFDGTTCSFLQIVYADLQTETLKGGTDEQLVEWAFKNGKRPTELETEMFNAFMGKRSWRDKYTERLHVRLQEVGLPVGLVESMFDFIEVDEGRKPRF